MAMQLTLRVRADADGVSVARSLTYPGLDSALAPLRPWQKKWEERESVSKHAIALAGAGADGSPQGWASQSTRRKASALKL